MYADGSDGRHDPAHLLSARLQIPLPALALALETAAAADATGATSAPAQPSHMSSQWHPGSGVQPGYGGVISGVNTNGVSGNGGNRIPTGSLSTEVMPAQAIAWTPGVGGSSSLGNFGSSSKNDGSSGSDGIASAWSHSINGTAATATDAAAASAAAAASTCAPSSVTEYRELLTLLDGVAAHAIDSALEGMQGAVTEPHVARILSRYLPPGGRLRYPRDWITDRTACHSHSISKQLFCHHCNRCIFDAVW